MNIEDLFSPRALRKLRSWSETDKPNNKHYAKLRKKLREYPITSWYCYGRSNKYKPVYKVTDEFLEEFLNCPDFSSCGHSKQTSGKTEWFHNVSVLPKGNRRWSYYKFITDRTDIIKEENSN